MERSFKLGIIKNDYKLGKKSIHITNYMSSSNNTNKMKRLLLVNAFIILFVITSLKNGRQDSSSFVSAVSLQRFKTKHDSNQEWNVTHHQHMKELQFEKYARVRRSNEVNLNTTKNDNNNGNAKVIYVIAVSYTHLTLPTIYSV